jgi:hypothetical protein
MMFAHDGKSVMMDDNTPTEEDLQLARAAVEKFVCDDPSQQLRVLQMLGLESYMRIIRPGGKGTTARRVMS